MAEQDVNLKIKANSEDAQKAVDDFKKKLDKATSGASSVFEKKGAAGLGQAVGHGIGGVVGGAVGGIAGKAIGGAASMVGENFGELGSVLKSSFKDVIRNDLLPGLNQSIGQINERKAAAGDLKGELGEAAAFMSQKQIKSMAKPFMAMADLRAKGASNVDRALLGFSGQAGLKENVKIGYKGAKSTFTREEVIDEKKVAKDLAGAAKNMKQVFKEK